MKYLFVINLCTLLFKLATSRSAPSGIEVDGIASHQGLNVSTDVVGIGLIALGTHVKGSDYLMSWTLLLNLASLGGGTSAGYFQLYTGDWQ